MRRKFRYNMLMIGLKVIALTGLAYMLATLVMGIYMYLVALLTIGTVCCELWMYVVSYSSFVVLAVLVLVLTRTFLKSATAQRTKRVLFFEMAYIVMLLYVGSKLGSIWLDAAGGTGPGLYVSILLAIVVSFVVSVCVNLWVLRRNVQKAHGQRGHKRA